MKDNKRIKGDDAQVRDKNEIKSEVENNLNSAISITSKSNYPQDIKGFSVKMMSLKRRKTWCKSTKGLR